MINYLFWNEPQLLLLLCLVTTLVGSLIIGDICGKK